VDIKALYHHDTQEEMEERGSEEEVYVYGRPVRSSLGIQISTYYCENTT
jgi:hypothetical protein